MSSPDLVSVSSRIAADFGPNANYVEELLQAYLQQPDSIGEEWRQYFETLVGRPAPPPAAPTPPSAPVTVGTATAEGVERQPLRGPALKIVENMQQSLEVPTATSMREIPLRVLDENRKLANKHLQAASRPRVSFTHFIAFAILRALERFPRMNDAFDAGNGEAARLVRPRVNLGVAVDVMKKDGSRTLLVPNVKGAECLDFAEFCAAYDDIVRRARDGKLQVADFQGTTVSLTNPGTIGTTASAPRLMAGQGTIVATGAIDYPAEFQAMAPEALSQLGVSKVMTITSTYDHRIIQGAESGGFLALVHKLLLGEDGFYEQCFADLRIPYRPMHWAVDRNPALLGGDRRLEEITKQAKVLELINMYRVRGHLKANLDPLCASSAGQHPELDIEHYGLTIWDLDREFFAGGLGGVQFATLREILDMLDKYYCGTVGVEYRHTQSPVEKEWIRARVETDPAPIPVEIRKRMLWKLISAEAFERFLGRKYIGQKRFSIEGNETLVSALNELIELASDRGVTEVMIGMSHRGRLNVMANVIGFFCKRIFAGFEGGVHPDFPHDARDVKYHQGASGVRETASGNKVLVTVAPNPSHLEYVDPVVIGRVRARQDAAGPEAAKGIIAILLHGDSAFAGEGVVAETLNMSQLEGYSVDGTIHLIVNNQIGFTTTPEHARSSTYSTDVAKAIQAPIFHVNGDDPDAAYHVMRLALDYRQEFKKDIVVDLIGFRRHGHNEGDEPTYTQPVMYKRVEAHPGVRAKYADLLVEQGHLSREAVDALVEERYRRYEESLAEAKRIVAESTAVQDGLLPVPEPEDVPVIPTGIDLSMVRTITEAISSVPMHFHLNPKIVSLVSRRARMASGEVPCDWGFAEGLAFGSLVLEGTPVRLTGEDSQRGTFSQRHAVFVDALTGDSWLPLRNLSPDQADIQIFDSPLSEAGVLGFEYGYSVDAPHALVLWEAQFGDFLNAAQVAVDQFIAPGETKWNQKSRLVLLLPHGYEGQGPEHSSARLERFLQLAAEQNMRICLPSTPAQYFHMLRRQMRQEPKPLIVMTPKSLLRLPEATSSIEEITSGGFQAVLADRGEFAPGRVRRLVFCTGKVYYDITSERGRQHLDGVAVVRLEQLYPFPAATVAREAARLGSPAEVVWAQEEPRNMGAWSFVQPRLVATLGRDVGYAGRAASASTAIGSHKIHVREQQQLVADALGVR